MSILNALAEVPLNEKRLERDIGEKMFLEMIVKEDVLVLEGILESFEPNLILSLDNCKVVGSENKFNYAGLTKAPFIWDGLGIKTIAEKAVVAPKKIGFRGVVYRNDLIDSSNLNNVNSCRIFQMIKLFLDEGLTLERFHEFKKSMEKEEKEIIALNNVSIGNKIHKKGSG